MTINNNLKNVLYDSDDNNTNLADIFNISPLTIQNPSKNKQTTKISKYTILSKKQIHILESEFIKRKLKFNKSNIRKLSADLNLPYKRCINYFMGVIRYIDSDINKNASKMISEIKNIQQEIDKSWEMFIIGCKKYNR